MARHGRIYVWITGSLVLGLVFSSLACAAQEPTPTPVPPAPPAPPMAPTAAPAPVPTLASGAPTPVAPLPTPTRAAPTPTPLVTGKPLYGGTLRYVPIALDVSSLDPRYGVARAEMPAQHLVFGNIVNIGTKWEIVPGLARSWQISDGGKTVAFRLNEGMKFHDGTTLDAETLKWFIEWQLDPKTAHLQRPALEAAGIERVSVSDKYTFSLHLKRPYRPLLSLLAQRSGYVPSPTAVQKLGKDFAKGPVGAGPFRFEEWRPSEYLKIRRSDSYWEKDKPYLDAIIFQNVPDEGVRVAMLRTDETDIVEDIPAQLVEQVRRSPALVLHEFASDRMYTLIFDLSYDPFSNKSLRQAVAYGIDRERLAKAAFGGAARVASGYEGGGWAYNPNLTIPYDPQKAKAKLAEAGYPSGVTLPIWCPSSPFWVQMCETHQAILSEVGIKLDIRLIPLAERVTAYYDGRAHFGPQLRSPITADPGSRLRTWFGPETYYNTRMTRYFNPELTRLLDEADGIYDTVEAKKLYDQVQKMLVDEVIWTFDVWVTVFTGLNKRVQNWVVIPDLYPRLGEVWFQKG